MGKEMKQLTEDLPEGIILFKQQTEEVVLVNTEFRNLFQLLDTQDLIRLQVALRSTKISIYNNQKGQEKDTD